MRKVGFFELPNGITVYYQCDPGVHLGGVGVKVGSIHDPKNKRGLAHFVEHCISKKSTRHADGRRVDLSFLKFMGGPDDDIAISTDRSSTFYGTDHLARRQNMLAVFDIMASFVHGKERLIDVEDARIEAAAVHNESYLRGDDWMVAHVDDLMHQTMYEKNPARNRIDCEVGELENFSLADVKKFVCRYYVPKNTFVILLGPSFAEAKVLAERYFSDWQTETKPTLDYDHSDDFPVLKSIRSREEVRPVLHQYHCALGFPTETFLTEDAEAIDLLAKIWELHLMWRLREGNKDFFGGAYRTPVFAPRTFVHGMIYAAFATVGEKFAERAEAIVLEEAHKFRDKFITDDEFGAAKKRMLYEHLNSIYASTPAVLAERIRQSAANGDPELSLVNGFRERWEKLSRRRVHAVANKYFTKYYARVLIKPA